VIKSQVFLFGILHKKIPKIYLFCKYLAPDPWARGSELWGCPRMEDTLLIDIFVRFDFPVPEFGVYDAGTPERIIGCMAEQNIGFTSLGITDMKFVHMLFSFLIPAFALPTVNQGVMNTSPRRGSINRTGAYCTCVA
jgi:hypothetical protein